MCLALNHRPCLKSSPDATIHGDVPRRVRITTASIKAPFPGDHARQGHRYAANADGPPLTFTHACTIRPSFPGVDFTIPSIFVSDRPAHRKKCVCCHHCCHCVLRFSHHPLQISIVASPPCSAPALAPPSKACSQCLRRRRMCLSMCSTANHSLTHLTCIQHLLSFFFSISLSLILFLSTFPSLRPLCPPITLPSSDNSRRSLLPYPRLHPVRCAAPHPTPLFFPSLLLILFLLPVLKTPRPILSVTWLSTRLPESLWTLLAVSVRSTGVLSLPQFISLCFYNESRSNTQLRTTLLYEAILIFLGC